MNELNIQYHLTDEELLCMSRGTGTPEETDRWLEHISDCDFCAQRMAEIYEKGPMLKVTPMFEENVWQKIEATSEKRQERWLTPRAGGGRVAKPEHTPRAFRSYPFKVALAACMTMVMMSAGAFGTAGIGTVLPGRMELPELPQRMDDLRESPLDWLTKGLEDASSQWIDKLEGVETL